MSLICPRIPRIKVNCNNTQNISKITCYNPFVQILRIVYLHEYVDIHTLKQTNKLKGIVMMINTQDKTMRIRPHCVASPFVESSAVNNNKKYNNWLLILLKIR